MFLSKREKKMSIYLLLSIYLLYLRIAWYFQSFIILFIYLFITYIFRLFRNLQKT